MTIAEALRQAHQLIHSETPKLDVELLLAEILGRDRTYLYTWPGHSLTDEQIELFSNWFNRRLAGEPVAHILQHRGFWTFELEVTPDTLIPRPDTELLVEIGLELLTSAEGPARILDLGTGTGAIALALASELPSAKVLATDVMEEAVALAERNRKRLTLENIEICRSDWWSEVSGCFNLILSNPPYIAQDDPHLVTGDLRFEPRSALVAQEEGLADIRHIVMGAPDYLVQGGWLLLEHGWQQAEAVRTLLRARGFSSVFSRVDYGGNERVSGGQWT